MLLSITYYFWFKRKIITEKLLKNKKSLNEEIDASLYIDDDFIFENKDEIIITLLKKFISCILSRN